MVGGGRGAFIGAVHRMAARLDDRYELVAGALSVRRRARRSESAADLHIAPERCYATSPRWPRKEAGRPDGIDVVAIVTPNHLHYARRPRVPRRRHPRDLRQAADHARSTTRWTLAQAVRASGLVFALTHNYTGYPMVRQAREMVAAGELGADPRGAGRVPAGLADDGARGQRPEAGGVAHRPGAARRRRLRRRHRHACLQPGASSSPACAVDRLAADLTTLRAGPRLDDNAHDAAALRRRRARHAVGEPGRAGQRERAAPARLRRARPGSNGRRSSRTCCASRPVASRRA